jgi:hypothetical protein
MTQKLADPRRFETGELSPLMRAAEDLAAAEDTSGQPLLMGLARKIAALLDSGDESALREAMRNPSSSAAARALFRALDTALTPTAEQGGVNLHLFAIPILLVVGAQSAQCVSGVLREPEAIRSLFEQSGALGHCRNFGISNAFAAIESVEAIPWSTLYSMAKAQSWDASLGLDLAPADVDVSAQRETVHLRFISGAALIPNDAPAFVAAAGNVGRWGMQLTHPTTRRRLLQRQETLAAGACSSPGNWGDNWHRRIFHCWRSRGRHAASCALCKRAGTPRGNLVFSFF